MSDLRPEFRPLTFPRSVEPHPPAAVANPADFAGGEVHPGPVHHESEHGMPNREMASHGMASHSMTGHGLPSHEMAGHGPTPHGSQFDLDEDVDCDQDPVGEYDPVDSHDTVSIAGRIGASAGEPTPGELVEMLLRLGQRLRGHLDTRFGTFGLSDARFAALSVIREAAPAGCTQAHLATKLGQCESSISTLVERMRASRLLYRLRAKADRRKRVLMLTDDGRQLFDQGLAARDREAGSLFSRMSQEEQQQLASLLGRLFATLDRIGESAEHVAERDAA